MSRVFSQPHYSEQAGQKFKTYAGMHDEAIRSFYVMGQMGTGRDSLAAMMVEAGLKPSKLHVALDAAYEVGAKTHEDSSAAYCLLMQHLHRHLRVMGYSVVSDDAAVFGLFHLHLEGVMTTHSRWVDEWKSFDAPARLVSTYGMVASFASPLKASDASKKVALFTELNNLEPTLAQAMVVSESWRFAMHSGEAREHVRDVIMQEAEPDITKLRVTKGGWAEAYPDAELYVIAGLCLICYADKCYVLDHGSRAQLADVLWSAGNSVLYAMNYQGGGGTVKAVQAARDSVSYVKNALRSCKGDVDRQRKIARHMKTCYAILLAEYGIDRARVDEAEFALKQVVELREAAELERDGFESWYARISGWDQRLAIDLGTAWNLLPGIDIDVAMLDAKTEEKLNAPRAYSAEAWEDFMAYSRNVITAHVLVAYPSVAGEWSGVPEGVNPEAVDWVISCRAKRLAYPPRDSRMVLLRGLPYVDHMTNWFWKADSVTHVYADVGRYEDATNVADMAREDMDELLYALTHAPYLSGNITPAEARTAWCNGKPPGDCVLLLAGKSENTKVPGKTRETAAEDDIRREILSEVDSNLVLIAAAVEGVAMRAGRRKLEMKIGKLICIKNEAVMLIALDVTGWSPNAPRDKHMGFMDMLMSFYDVEEGCVPSKAFDDVNIVMSKRGYHRVWKAEDGTMQGFTGTGDSILHSLMAQWSFVRAREAGHFPPGATISKVTLIDDILLRMKALGVKVEDAYHAIEAGYLSLGYSPDAIKTLMSMFKGHFLNRLYANDFEVITASKIWAKANRSFERQYAGVWSLVDSVFAGYLGAADRGACAHAAYTSAVWRSMIVMARMGMKADSYKSDYCAVSAWVPRALGGHGMPTFAQWITRECADSISSGLGAVTTIIRVIRPTDPMGAAAASSYLVAFTSQMLEPRSASATMDDPYSVKVRGIIDPESVGRTISRKGASKVTTAPVFVNFIEGVDAPAYERVLDTFLRSHVYPAPLIAGIGSALPHAVAHSITARAESSECVIAYVPWRDRKKAANDLRTADKKAVCYWRTVDARILGAGIMAVSGSDLAEELRVRSLAMSGYHMTYISSVSALDALGVAVEGHHIELILPAHSREDIYDGLGATIGGRTSTTRALFELQGPMSKVADPVSECIRTAMCVCAAAGAFGLDARLFEQIFVTAWIGSNRVLSLPRVIVGGSNPRRAAKRIARSTYTVCMAPNSAGSVVVNASKAIHEFDAVHLSFDWMSVIYALKAAGLLDMELGAVNPAGEVRKYTIRGIRGLVSTVDYGPGPEHVDYGTFPGILSDERQFAAHVERIMGSILAADDDESDDEDDANPYRGLDVRMTARTVLASLHGEDLITGRRPFPLAGHIHEKAPAAVATVTDVPSGRVDPVPQEVLARLNHVETRAIHALHRLVVGMLESEADAPLVGYASGLRAMVHIGLRSVFETWDLLRWYPAITGIDETMLREATRHVHRIMRSSDHPLVGDLPAYWLGAAAKHEAQSMVATLPVHVRYRSIILSSLLSTWAMANTQRIEVLVELSAKSLVDSAVKMMDRALSTPKVMRDDIAEKVRAELYAVHSSVERFLADMVQHLMRIAPAVSARRLGYELGIRAALKDFRQWFVMDVIAPAVAAQELILQERAAGAASDELVVRADMFAMGAIADTAPRGVPAWLAAADLRTLAAALRDFGIYEAMSREVAYAEFGDDLQEALADVGSATAADV